MAMYRINNVFNKNLTIYYPKLKVFEWSFVVMKNEFNTFLAYILNLNPIISRLTQTQNTDNVSIHSSYI